MARSGFSAAQPLGIRNVRGSPGAVVVTDGAQCGGEFRSRDSLFLDLVLHLTRNQAGLEVPNLDTVEWQSVHRKLRRADSPARIVSIEETPGREHYHGFPHVRSGIGCVPDRLRFS